LGQFETTLRMCIATPKIKDSFWWIPLYLNFPAFRDVWGNVWRVLGWEIASHGKSIDNR
jgi:hypothetical protein